MRRRVLEWRIIGNFRVLLCILLGRHSPSKAVLGFCWCQKGLPSTGEYALEGFEKGFREARERMAKQPKQPKVPKGGICWPCFLSRCGLKKDNHCPCCRRGHT